MWRLPCLFASVKIFCHLLTLTECMLTCVFYTIALTHAQTCLGTWCIVSLLDRWSQEGRLCMVVALNDLYFNTFPLSVVFFPLSFLVCGLHACICTFDGQPKISMRKKHHPVSFWCLNRLRVGCVLMLSSMTHRVMSLRDLADGITSLSDGIVSSLLGVCDLPAIYHHQLCCCQKWERNR